MTAKELAEKLNAYVEAGHGDDEVVINIDEAAVGPCASVPVKFIYPGFDWESGTVRIDAAEPIIRKK